MEAHKVENMLTPPRPKRFSPSFDRDQHEDGGLGCGGFGEGNSTGDGIRPTDFEPDSPTTAKRRRIEMWGYYTPSTLSSCSGTPSRGTTPDTTLEDSMLSTPTDSPVGTMTKKDRQDFKKRYKKDELWPAIESNYQYLMDDEIIETCKSTESDLSWDEEDVTINTKVSFTEFMQQYKELTDWLNQIQQVTQRKGTSRSEKYLNQAYHEELLQSSPRRKLFNDYAKQLLKRYPSLKEEISLRIQLLNSQWQELQEMALPQHGYQDTKTMLCDLDLDLSCIRRWLNGVEGKLLPLSVKHTWTEKNIEGKLKEHQVLQREIESQSKVISAVLKLSERLQNDENVELDYDFRTARDKHQSAAVSLERRWHNVWLRSLEWQCRLEEALAQLKGLVNKPLHSSDPSLWHDFDNSASFAEGFSSDDQVDLSFKNSGEGESEPSDTCEGLGEFSDEPNSSDVIPFYDDEYEKIKDVEDQTDEDREVQQLSDEMRERSQGSKLLAASTLTKSDTNLSEFKLEIMDTLDESKFGRCFLSSKMKTGKSESRDIGYSSEGYSNDEQLDPSDKGRSLIRAPSLNGLHFNAKPVLHDLSPGGTENGVIRRRPASLPLDSNLHSLTTDLSTSKDSPWRHSITSAYDTSSNCGSDPEAIICGEDGCTIDPSAETNYKAIINSPTKEFYKMITVDTDFSTDRNDTDEQLSSTDHGCSPKMKLPETCIRIPEDGMLLEGKALDGITEIVQSKNFVQVSNTERCSSSVSGFCAEDIEKGVSILADSTLEPNGQLPVCHILQEDQPSNVDEEFSGLGDSQWQTGSHDRVRKPKSKRRVVGCDGVDGTDTSSPRSGADSVVDSSCEASGEETTDSESSDGEFSTASDDDRSPSVVFNSYNTLVGSDRNLLDRYEACSHSANQSGMPRSISSYSNAERVAVRTKMKGRRTRRERPWSIVAVSDFKKEWNPKDKPVFISESAIDAMYSSTSAESHSEVYTSTPLSKYQGVSVPSPCTKQYATFPRDKSRLHRPRHMRRSKSMEDPENKANSISVPSKRKLAYDQSANRTESDFSQDNYPISILISSPDLEVNRSYRSEDHTAPLSLIEGLEHIKVYSSSSGSETDGAYLTPKQSLSESGSESDEFVNSNGSFSETAWDNYQDPLYPTASEAPTEEPLHWEPQDEMEFEEEEFSVDDGIKLSAEVIAERSDKLRAKERKPPAYTREDDSDSDLEDLHHVIQQSVEQLHVTDSSLKKQRRDPMGTGISLDPSKYAEHILTCETNLKCLEEVLELPVISGHEAHQIEVLMKHWKQLWTFAMDRHQQSQQLCRMYGDLTKVKATVSEVMKEMISGSFDEITQLENVISVLQSKTASLCRDSAHVSTVKESVAEFSQENPAVPMDQFKVKAAQSSSLLEKTAKRCQGRVRELETLLEKWKEFVEVTKELSTTLARERKQLQLMEFSQSLMLEGTEGELETCIADLRAISSDLETYEDKLNHLRELKGQLKDICSDQVQKDMAATLGSLGSEQFALKHWCDESFAKLIEKEGEENVLKGLVAAQASRPEEGRSIHPMLSRLLKGAAPMVVMAALMYLAMPDSWEDLGDLGITITPELQYIRGPPPT